MTPTKADREKVNIIKILDNDKKTILSTLFLFKIRKEHDKHNIQYAYWLGSLKNALYLSPKLYLPNPIDHRAKDKNIEMRMIYFILSILLKNLIIKK